MIKIHNLHPDPEIYVYYYTHNNLFIYLFIYLCKKYYNKILYFSSLGI